MANELLLVNPRKRTRRKTRRSPAQRAATRRLVAANRGRKRRRRRNPITASRTPTRTATRTPTRAASSRRRRRTYRRNPARRGGGFNLQNILNTAVIPAATAGLGALGLDVIWGYAPVPATWKVGPIRHVVKGIGAIMLGVVAGMVVTRRTADQMALGALTVVFHDAYREGMANFMPNVPLGYYSAGQSAGFDPTLGMYVGSPRMTVQGGESVPSRMSTAEGNEMGYYVQEGAGGQY